MAGRAITIERKKAKTPIMKQRRLRAITSQGEIYKRKISILISPKLFQISGVPIFFRRL